MTAAAASTATRDQLGRARAAALFTVILWASAFVGIRAALAHFQPAHLALVRYLVASLVLLVIARRAGVRPPRQADVPRVLLMGLIGIAAYNVLLNVGEQTVSAAAASLIVNGVPVITALLSASFLGERLGRLGWLGLLVSFTGATVIALSGDGALRLERGAILLFLAAIAMSVYFVVQKPLLRRYTPLETVSYAIWCGTAWLFFFSPGVMAALRSAPADALGAVVYLGIFPAAVAYVAYSYALAAMPAGRTASFLYLVPVLTIGIAWLWLREVPTARTLIGGMIVMSGVLLVNTRGPTRASGGGRGARAFHTTTVTARGGSTSPRESTTPEERS